MKNILIFVFLIVSLYAKENLSSIKVQLNAQPSFEFAAFYMAKELGYYKEMGLEVELLHGDGESFEKLQASLEDDIDIALGCSSVIAHAINNQNLIVLSYLFHTSPLVAVSKKSKIDVSQCFYRKSSFSKSSIEIMLQKMGVSCVKPYSLTEFFKDPNGIIVTSIANQKFIAHNGYVIEPRKYGYDLYGDIIFTSKKRYQKNKTLFRKFTIATIKGWRYALRHISQSTKIIHQKYVPHKDILQLEEEANELLAYAIYSPKSVGIFEPNKLYQELNLLLQSGIITQQKDIYDIVDPLFINTLPLTLAQREMIATHPIYYSETTWPPFTIVKNKKMTGMIQAYLDVIAKKSGFDFRYVYKKHWSEVLEGIKNGTLQMAMATGETSSRKKYAVFSKPYNVYPIAVASNREKIYSDIRDLFGKRVAVGKDYTAHEILKKYPKITIVTVKNTEDAIKALHNKSVEAAVDIMPTLAYYIVKNDYRDMVISATFKEKFALKAMFSKKYKDIVPLFNMALESINKEDKEALEKRFSPKVVYVINTKKEQYFMLFIISLAIIILILVYMGFKLQEELKRRTKIEKELQKLANKDPLTNLYNRRYFNLFMQNEIAIMKRYGGVMLFAIFDIDNFKRYNDLYGHLKGDDILREVAKVIKAICKRESDFIFRLGGEEFGIYSHIENVDNIEEYIQRFVHKVEELGIEHKQNYPYGVVTISLGAVVVKVSQGSDVSLGQIYKYADELMYEAKKMGKNRAVFERVQL